MLTCSIKGCERPKYAASFCSIHYNRIRRSGSPDPTKFSRASFSERLWRQIDKRGPEECWPWKAGVADTGYGTIRFGGRKGRTVFAHRSVWEEVNGPIPKRSGHHGAVVMHTCDNRRCCNPAHMKIGTQKENVADMDAKQRRNQRNLVGEAHGMSKWTVAQVLKVKSMSGTYKEISEATGVAVGSVKAIKRGAVWRHI